MSKQTEFFVQPVGRVEEPRNLPHGQREWDELAKEVAETLD